MSGHRLAVIAGDGIGNEVVPVALQVLDALGSRHGFSFDEDALPWGCEFYQRTGMMMPDDGLARLEKAEAILLGAVGAPGVPDHVSLWGLLIPIRRTFGQYVNLRPVRLWPGVHSPLRDVTPDRLDLVIVRENNEGEYSEIGGRLYRGTPDEMAVQESVFTRRGVDRIMDFAFGLAEQRRRCITSATKSNGITHTMPFWDEIFAEHLTGHPEVTGTQVHLDALTAQLVLDPGRFDVIVGSNLFGDVLSDLAAAIAGSIGMAPSANLDPTREHPSMFEPVHGSAPDIAGKGIANPVGMLWTTAMLVEHLGHPEAAADLMHALAMTLHSGARTPDLGGTATTAEVAEEVIGHLGSTRPDAER